ncbi:MAG: hypothetical protein ABF461_02900 [Zymomonas mobilis subsp. pomaceae]|uniref:Uncharacterized protein n=1 Tax=Zymomonas mobilis subsp. pomaceae (strain ATCC 29192 / DSM 22645 / JCM 10191 / CCUG 17912 / NBRC 13757 / NCIMB 11200 / NRRL B-4491 / Barker I) TaxID=579138 RepID=F8EUF3_ZYMMT|nr:hypothetical protein [Zymomonas mobilis]AEI37169.1 hypothetical protein Zymop_0266 [Zymomonas mobilis subsp. pomaceae ATCC 29192]MDX5948539.1 hypothetical protein [Zymomonas mobilis subsp. pomaceae]GEB89847.1 hypothetical protein ZMO02_14840 [Zymomonas mobilis subsp. pomaceae]
MPCYEWIIEKGIGETRAALFSDGEIVKARIDPEEQIIRAGSILDVRLSQITNATGRALAVTEDDQAIWVNGVPRQITQGSSIRVEITRERVFERGIIKPPHARAVTSDTPIQAGLTLEERIKARGYPVSYQSAHQFDRLENAGWSEIIEQAYTGDIDFSGGRLRMALTPALTLFDIDGHLEALDLALKGTEAAAKAITCFDIGGSIGLDLPGLSGKAARQKVAEWIDKYLPPPFDRTGVNGFGFLQIIRPKRRPSLPEQIAAQPIAHRARQLLRQASRAKGAGKRTLTASSLVIDYLERHPEWIKALTRLTAAEIVLHPEPLRSIYESDVGVEFP